MSKQEKFYCKVGQAVINLAGCASIAIMFVVPALVSFMR